jgi:hypothetical protein
MTVDHEFYTPYPFVLMPESKIKTFWNILMSLLLIYTATFVPYRTAFIDEGTFGL